MKVLKSFEDFFNEEPKKPSSSMVIPSDDEESTIYDDCEDDDMALDPEDDDLEEAKDPYVITSKDRMRIQDIHDKAAGDKTKMEKLASTMCKLITDAQKALRRGMAAQDMNFNNIAKLFFARAAELTGNMGG